jgi:hypothetical protein
MSAVISQNGHSLRLPDAVFSALLSSASKGFKAMLEDNDDAEEIDALLMARSAVDQMQTWERRTHA